MRRSRREPSGGPRWTVAPGACSRLATVSRIALALLAPVAVLAACHHDAEPAPAPQPTTSVTPLGMASAATLVTTSNAPEILATLHHAREIALAPGILYVADASDSATDPDVDVDIVSVPSAPGGAATPAYPAQHGAEGLSFAGGKLAWIVVDEKKGGRVMSAQPGGAAKSIAKTYALDETLIAANGPDLFTMGDLAKGSADVIRLGSDAKPARVAAATGHVVRTAIAASATDVFWLQDDSIVRAPRAGGATTTVAAALHTAKVQRMAADASSVYWTDLGTGDPSWSGRVYRASLADGKVETISDAPFPFAVAVDADRVYWTSGPDVGGRILARDKSGGATYVLAHDLKQPRALAVDDRYVYWACAGDGAVGRVEKTPRASR